MQKNEEKSYQPLIVPNFNWVRATDHEGDLIVSPLEPGFGVTLGNALRRVMLSCVEGCAVTWVIINGANHEFSTLEGISEEVLQILLNIKKLVIKNKTGKPGMMHLSKSGPGLATAADITVDEHLEIVNKDHVLATLAANGKLDIQLCVEMGRGYKFAQWPLGTKYHEDGKIYVDSLFSPVQKVAYTVEKTRVGNDIDYDKLILSITTNGSVTVSDVVRYAASVLRVHFLHFLGEQTELNFGSSESTAVATEDVSVVTDLGAKNGISVDLFLKPIEDLELSVRAYNCLVSAGIKRVIDLVNLSDDDTLKIKNFGRKSLKEVKDVLVGLGLRFGMNIKEHDLKKALKDKSVINVGKFN